MLRGSTSRKTEEKLNVWEVEPLGSPTSGEVINARRFDLGEVAKSSIFRRSNLHKDVGCLLRGSTSRKTEEKLNVLEVRLPTEVELPKIN